MNKKLVLLAIIVLFLATPGFSAAPTVGELSLRIRGAHSSKGLIETMELAIKNIDLVVKILKMPKSDSFLRGRCVWILRDAAIRGTISYKEFFRLLTDQIFNIENYANKIYLVDEKRELEHLIVFFGYFPGGFYKLPLMRNFQNLFHLIQGLRECKLSFFSQQFEDEMLAEGKKLITLREPSQFITKLNQFSKKVQEAPGDEDGKRILIRYVGMLVLQTKEETK